MKERLVGGGRSLQLTGSQSPPPEKQTGGEKKRVPRESRTAPAGRPAATAVWHGPDGASDELGVLGSEH